MTDDTEFSASDVREVLDRFEQQDWERHTDNAFESVERYMEKVVEDGEILPESKVHMGLDLTLRERLTGSRRQDVTAMLGMGIILGAALERDVPRDSEREDEWRDGEFVLPESESE